MCGKILPTLASNGTLRLACCQTKTYHISITCLVKMHKVQKLRKIEKDNPEELRNNAPPKQQTINV